MLLHRVVVGLSDQVLKKQVFKICDSFTSVDTFRAMCCMFEAAQLNAVGGNFWPKTPLTTGTGTDNDVTPSATATRQNTTIKPLTVCVCRNCGGLHAPDRAACPTRSIIYHGCQKLGHLKKYYRSTRQCVVSMATSTSPSSEVSGAVSTTKTHLSPQSTIQVT